MANRGQLRTMVYERLGRPTTDTLLTSTEINDFINDALHFIAADYPWDWLEASQSITTTNGTDAYNVSTDYLSTIDARVVGNPPLVRYSIGELNAMFPMTSSGTPIAYAVYARQVVVRPIPVTTILPTIIHHYHKDEADLSADGNSPLMPATYHPAIAEVATSLAFRRAGNLNAAALADKRYADWKDRMVESVRRLQATNQNRNVADVASMPLPGAGRAAAQS